MGTLRSLKGSPCMGSIHSRTRLEAVQHRAAWLPASVSTKLHPQHWLDGCSQVLWLYTQCVSNGRGQAHVARFDSRVCGAAVLCCCLVGDALF